MAVRDAQVVAPAVTPAATAVTEADDTTLRARAVARRRRSLRGGGGSPVVAGSRGAGAAAASSRRIRTSAAVVAAAAPTAVATRTLPHRPRPGVRGRSTLSRARGTTRLPTPMARLARVSRRS